MYQSCVRARSARNTLCHRDHWSINSTQTEVQGTYGTCEVVHTATKGCRQCVRQMVTMEARCSWPFRACSYNVIHQLIIAWVKYCKECVNRVLRYRRLTTLIVQPVAKARIAEGASWVALLTPKPPNHTGREHNSILVRGSFLSVDSSPS